MKKEIVLLLCLSLLLTGFGLGCQSAAEKPAVPKQNGSDMDTSERRVMASRLSQMAEEVEGVQKASVVVSDMDIVDTALPGTNNDTLTGRTNKDDVLVMVGIVLDENVRADVNKASEIRQTVRQKLKASDERISQVLVTSDPNLVERISKLAADVIEGKPIKDFEDEIKDINNKIRQQ
ncbi:MAG: YhcN/YlaJ family sporulation lipoprotein [Syntrophomonadaceae bacterium]|nr:YhcN/YlaJ family sporulation lipoprotein [Syntrophomonadaceae bacterium]